MRLAVIRGSYERFIFDRGISDCRAVERVALLGGKQRWNKFSIWEYSVGVADHIAFACGFQRKTHSENACTKLHFLIEKRIESVCWQFRGCWEDN
jgi:hypothetical protein